MNPGRDMHRFGLVYARRFAACVGARGIGTNASGGETVADPKNGHGSREMRRTCSLRVGGGMMKSAMWVLVGALVCAFAAGAAAADGPAAPAGPYSPAPPPEGVVQYSYSWQALPLLPRRYQNHCGFYRGNFVCADHCGPTYQVYYCSPVAVGCCHVGEGYCGGDGSLRCGTWPFVFPFL
jgi:hypothetical protein